MAEAAAHQAGPSAGDRCQLGLWGRGAEPSSGRCGQSTPRALADGAHRALQDLGYDNAHVIWGDGTLGYPEAAPFDIPSW
ncbi:MAG: hypothetical protein R2789_02155 [Microthrixaceae bacterium]